jgi:hypothetical protein
VDQSKAAIYAAESVSRVGLRDTEERIHMWYVAIHVFHESVVESIHEYSVDTAVREGLEAHYARFPQSLLQGL